MAWPELDPQIVALLLDGAEELGSWAWHKLTGDSIDDKAKRAIAALRQKGIDAMIKAMQDELEQQAAVHNFEMQLLKLGPLAENVLDAFVVKGDVPPLDLPVIEVICSTPRCVLVDKHDGPHRDIDGNDFL